MRTRIIIGVLSAVVVSSVVVSRAARSEAPPKAAAKPTGGTKPAQSVKSVYAFEARVSVDKPIVVGDGPHGLRRIVPIAGGTVDGPRLKGSVVPGGADWQFVRPDGTLQIEAKYTLLSDDGVSIMITNRGVRRGPKEVIEKLARGEAVDPSLYYFRTTAEFEAPVASKYAWLNNSVFVGVAERQANAAIIRFYEVQ
jgi:Protein of unknown function (DUF3237)